MEGTCSVGPSELRLKKELTALSKSRFRRDPNTHTSWRSPSTSTPLGASFKSDYGREDSEDVKAFDNLSGSLELPSGLEKRRSKVYISKWGHHSATDEAAAKFTELDLEENGRRWSRCRSLDGFDSNAVEEKCLSNKYRPRTFDEIAGQNIVTQSLKTAVLKGIIAPAYLFHGPHGTGKSSTARVFAAALNCQSTEDDKPCLSCTECNKHFTKNGFNIKEINATNKKEIGKIRLLLKQLPTITAFARYQVFAIDECHNLSPNSWSAFMKFLDEPLSRVVFIFTTIDPDILPGAVVSRCEKYLFSKMKDVDIAFRLGLLCAEENLDFEWDALDLVASNSDGSLQDAETTLDQLSLLGKKITTSLVNDLVGVVSNEKLLDLLEKRLRLSSNRSALFTTTLLQLGPRLSQPSPSCSSSRPSIKRLHEGLSEKARESSASENKSNLSLSLGKCVSASKLDAIWRKCVEKCDLDKLRHLLWAHGKLISITETNGVLIAYVAFEDGIVKSSADRYLRSITDSISIVLKRYVKVSIVPISEEYLKALKSPLESPSTLQLTDTMEFLDKEGKSEHDRVHTSSEKHRRSVENKLLVTAWLQDAENSEVPLVCHSKESKQENVNNRNPIKCVPEHSISFKHCNEGESDEIEEVETNDSRMYNNGQNGGRIAQYHYPMSPSLLHDSSFRANINPDSLGYDLGLVRSGLCCWKTKKSNMGKVKQGNHAKTQRADGCFGQC